MTMKKAVFTNKSQRLEVEVRRTPEGRVVAERRWSKTRGGKAKTTRVIAKAVQAPHAVKAFERMTASAEANGWERA